MLVGHHRNAVGAAAEQESEYMFARLDGLSQRVRKIGIINAVGAVGAVVGYGIPHLFEVRLDALLELESRVVGGYGDALLVHGYNANCGTKIRRKLPFGCI